MKTANQMLFKKVNISLICKIPGGLDRPDRKCIEDLGNRSFSNSLNSYYKLSTY